jgi:MFS family permease
MTYKPLHITERAGLYLTVFLTGAAVMVIELLGTRLIASFYGVSLYVWSSLISVTMIALAALLTLSIPWMTRPVLLATDPLGRLCKRARAVLAQSNPARHGGTLCHNKHLFNPLINLYIMQSLVKGFTVFYFVLLPVFYAEKFIDSSAIGYIGALFITMLIIGAVIVARWLHNLETKQLLQMASVVAICASVLLFIAFLQNNLFLLMVSFGFMGLVVGTAMSSVNAFAAQVTTRGDRYKSMAKLGMLTDIIRIVFPLLVSGAVILATVSAAIILIIVTTVVFFLFSSSLPRSHSLVNENLNGEIIDSVRKNRNFLYVLSLEFLDSFSSSQLFVFLPLIFLAKSYSIESSLLLQSFIFLGYLSGRLFVSFLTKIYSGINAIAYAEIGMVITIILLLATSNLWILYMLSYTLGIFARGTAPAIKALAFDSLTEHQVKKGSALHVVAGDSGSALGQLLFGFSVTWYGTNSPFIAAAGIAAFIAVICLVKPIHIKIN